MQYYFIFTLTITCLFSQTLLDIELSIMQAQQCKEKFKSQYGQDKWIIKLFKNKKNGFFVDLAATDGCFLSNTWTLEKKYNWQGICIEPNPAFFLRLKKSRSSINLQECIDGTNKDIYFLASKGNLGGIIDYNTDNNIKLTSSQLEDRIQSGEIIKFSTKTLKQILDENNAPKIIDYLSLDVEGSETRILENFPFNEYTFLAMTIERPPPKLHRVLVHNGYVFIKNNACDGYYVHKSLPKAAFLAKKPYTPLLFKR